MQSVNPERKKRRQVDGPLPAGDAYWTTLRSIGLNAGLHSVGVTSVDPLDRAREQIQQRIDNDFVNDMQFTFRNPVRSTTPSLIVQDARTIIVGAYSYFVEDADEGLGTPAHIARYAWFDAHHQMREALTAMKDQLRIDGHRAVVFADDNAIVDREIAYRAGIGWFGKNANILIPGAGSYFILGCVVTTAQLPLSEPVADSCGTCTRCIPACPTDAIAAPGVIDANRCLSWLLQKPGVFDRRFRVALGSRIYGCDDCQSSCPHTQRWSVPVTLRSPVRRAIETQWILESSDADILQECESWYIHERNPQWIRRNALIIMGNTAQPTEAWVHAALQEYTTSAEPVLRAQAIWAAARLGLSVYVPQHDADPVVADELSHLPTLRDDL